MDEPAQTRQPRPDTPEDLAERALDAVKAMYPGEVDGLTVKDLGEVAYMQVADMITDLLHLVTVAGEDVEQVLVTALNNLSAESDDRRQQ